MAETVNVAVTGALWLLPLNSNIEITGTDTEIPDEYNAGFISEDGLTRTTNRETEGIPVWQNAATVREAVTSADVEWQANILSWSKLVRDIYYGGEEVDGKRLINPAVVQSFHAVIDIRDTNATGGVRFLRYDIPNAQITELGEQVFNSADPIGCQITFKGIRDIDGTSEVLYVDEYEEEVEGGAGE